MSEKVKCKHYWNGNCSNCKKELIGACPDLDCYYKQLQRAKEENEVLRISHTELLYARATIDSQTENINILGRRLENVVNECSHLKEENKQLNKDWEEKKNLAYEIACENERLKEKNKRLKYALKEIEETIEHFKKYFSKEELNKVKFSDITTIEQIISEVNQ